MTPFQKSIVLGLVAVFLGLGAVFVSLQFFLPIAVRVANSSLGVMPSFGVMALGIGLMYYGIQRLWRSRG